MSKFKLANFELEAFYGFILSLKLKGKQNRHRMRIVREIEKALDEAKREHQNLIEEYALKGDDGKPVVIQQEIDGELMDTYDIEDMDGFTKEKKELNEELFMLDSEKFKEELNTLLVAMDESEIELSGNEAIIEQLVYERIEKAL